MSSDGTLADRIEIIETTTRMAWHADRREWNELERVLADEVLLDYTSLTGAQPATLPREQIISSWANVLGGLDATQHLVSNQLVKIDGESYRVRESQLAATSRSNSRRDKKPPATT